MSMMVTSGSLVVTSKAIRRNCLVSPEQKSKDIPFMKDFAKMVKRPDMEDSFGAMENTTLEN